MTIVTYTKFRSFLQRFRNDERGNVSVGVIGFIVTLLAAIGLVVDGGGQVAAHQQAQQVAASAARAGVLVTGGDFYHPSTSALPAYEAAQAAQNYLVFAGMTGTVTVNGGTVTVYVDHDYDTILLGYIFINQLPANAEASAQLIDGDTP